MSSKLLGGGRDHEFRIRVPLHWTIFSLLIRAMGDALFLLYRRLFEGYASCGCHCPQRWVGSAGHAGIAWIRAAAEVRGLGGRWSGSWLVWLARSRICWVDSSCYSHRRSGARHWEHSAPSWLWMRNWWRWSHRRGRGPWLWSRHLGWWTWRWGGWRGTWRLLQPLRRSGKLGWHAGRWAWCTDGLLRDQGQHFLRLRWQFCRSSWCLLACGRWVVGAWWWESTGVMC